MHYTRYDICKCLNTSTRRRHFYSAPCSYRKRTHFTVID